jgi:hypothetical protein
MVTSKRSPAVVPVGFPTVRDVAVLLLETVTGVRTVNATLHLR